MKTSYSMFIKIMPLVIAVLGAPFAQAQQPLSASGNVKWVNAPASLPQGAKLAMLKGDLGKSGPLAFQLKLPAGYKLMPHSSPAIERIIVVSGNVHLGAGEKFDNARTMSMSAGYVYWPDKSAFFALAKEETIIEINGAGPWSVKYVAAADDPTKNQLVSSSAVK